jgi:hypothetical protein
LSNGPLQGLFEEIREHVEFADSRRTCAGVCGPDGRRAGPDLSPSRTIRLICPFPPGGALDIASRAIAAEMSKTLGQPVAALVSLSNVLVVNPGRSRPRNHTLGAGGQEFGCDGRLSILST